MLVIRPELPDDKEAIRRVNRKAFGQVDEARLVDALRHSPAFIPELSLVAVHASQIVGHILFTRLEVKGGRSHQGLCLGPMGVLPERQREGIGAALARRGLDDARRLGHQFVIVVGHPEYYPRFGFVPAVPLGIHAPFPVPDNAFMALELQPRGLRDVRGMVEYAPEFLGV